MSAPRYNPRSPAVKRIMMEAAELRDPTYNYYAQPLEENIFEWHFTIRGPLETPFAKGIYHGRIILPPEYPMKPPNIIFLTPNGRFETNRKICLSISGYHPETWRPSWSIRTALLAMIGFMPSHGTGAIGSLDYTSAERDALAQKSLNFKCETCGTTCQLLATVDDEETVKEEIEKYAKELTVSKPKEQNTENNNSDSEEVTQSSELEIDDVHSTLEEVNEGEKIESLENEDRENNSVITEISPPIITRSRYDEIASLILMWVLILAIAFLAYRRLHKHFGLDLVKYFYSITP